MHMRVRLVMVAGNDVLRIHDTHTAQVFFGYVRHQLVRQFWCIPRHEAQRDMTYKNAGRNETSVK